MINTIFMGITIGVLAIMLTPSVTTAVNASTLPPPGKVCLSVCMADQLDKAQAHLDAVRQAVQQQGNQSDSGQ